MAHSTSKEPEPDDRARPNVPGWVRRRIRALPNVEDVRVSGSNLRLIPEGGKPVDYAVVLRSVLAAPDLEDLGSRTASTRNRSQHLLVATRSLPPARRRQLAGTGVSWIERSTGVVHLVGPGIFVHVEEPDGNPDDERASADTAERPARLVALSGTVAETILIDLRDRPIKVTELARLAGTSRGLVSRILRRLDAQGLTKSEGKGPNKRRVLHDPGGLLDLWAKEDPPRPETRTSLYIWARSPDDLYDQLLDLNDEGLRWALAGTAAANLYAPTLTTTPTPELWIAADVPAQRVSAAVGADAVDRGGNLILLQAEADCALHHATRWTGSEGRSSDRHGELQVVSAPRAYVESYHGTGRSSEVASALRAKLGY